MGLGLGLRNNLKDGSAELEQAQMLEPEVGDCYFWNGMLSAYYYRGRPHTAIESIEKSLAVGITDTAALATEGFAEFLLAVCCTTACPVWCVAILHS